MSKVYEVITSQIVEQLERGVVPWARPWKVDGLAPSNLVSRRPYRGINVFLLAFRAAATPWWLTFRQAKALGGAVRAGERSTPVIFWRWIDRRGREVEGEDAGAHDGGQRADRIPVLRYYSVFNLDQTEGIDPRKVPCAEACAVTELPTAEEIVARFPDPPTIEHRAQPRAFYRPATDSVTMPLRAAFDHALRVRKLGPEALQLADTFFFETLVRVHRAGEGAPYTGLKDEAPEAVILAVDEALVTGKVEGVVEELTAAASGGVRERFRHAFEARRHAEESVERGREYVEAYVELTHYVERLHQAALSATGHAEPSGTAAVHAQHGPR